VRNKIDLSNKEPNYIDTRCYKEVAVSAKTGAGLDDLRKHLKDCMGYQSAGEGTFMARRRHLDAIERALGHVVEGKKQLESSKAGELLAEELRLAQNDLGEITGEFTSDDLLGKIFSSFCIGK
jgi:tRNA modification GTPase